MARARSPRRLARPLLKPDQGLGLAVGISRPLNNAATWLSNLVQGPHEPGQGPIDKFTSALGMPTAEQGAASTQAMIDQAKSPGPQAGHAGRHRREHPR
jgi:hypothetical protein